ncbi:CTP:molybdopterin cytidylyltransferase MocA [Desulfotomaculum arcticum]|uniref:CTP:molybdopterin cytidylyltransferase MocA n=1 Tax=Desulfotruncus arcticus DSM 17038 TaxID=1121424 RepID=A0A1I2QNN9_9FIRM|nr:NTP transferase domain-containing protein [Desulfotruncus arcticus]SFG30205.1 CTP:molybdopterin cytidylyltransferase MocA [Desulfotomaculum arcticum] [Desulfotruncus arcticus DSM 17038]
MSGLAALVPAAGYSSRMNVFKPLLPLGETTVIARTVNTFFTAGLRRVLVVVGHRAGDLRPALTELKVQEVFNAGYAQGMFSSIQAGVNSLPPQVEAFLLLPADYPLVRPQTIKLLIDARQKSRAGIIYPCFEGERGHPPVISSGYKDEILNYSAGGGLRQILARHEDDALNVEVPDRGVVLDMDTPEDYRNLLQRAASIDLPDRLECEAVLRLAGTPPGVIVHSRAVAALACGLASELNQFGYALQLEMIAAAGLLHDVAKGLPGHAAAGAELITNMGFSGVARIIACHMGDGLEPGAGIGEKELVYLADKLLRGDKPVTLTERFSRSMQCFAGEPEIQQAVRARRSLAESIKQRVEQELGVQLDQWLEEWRQRGEKESGCGIT